MAPLHPLATIEELAASTITGKVVLLHSKLASEQLMPKGYPFYNPEEHQRIIGLLEEKRPVTIVAATSKNPGIAGALYPFPLFEDGNFDIPSVYTTEEEGFSLLRHSGRPAALRFASHRIPSRGCNVIARKGTTGGKRVLFCVHIDTKKNTPGALDNATGVALLLALAENLKDYTGSLGLEIVAMNGEDYYAAPGELQYLALNTGKLDELLLVVNIDATGYQDGRTAYSLYGCPDVLTDLVRQTLTGSRGFIEGNPWYQGDHMVFVLHGRPALAITSEKLLELSSNVIHTAGDRLELVDIDQLAKTATGLCELFLAMDRP